MLPAAAAEWATRFDYAAPVRTQNDNDGDERDFFGNTVPKMQWAGSVAIIPVSGPLIKGANFLERGFGAMSHESISDNIAKALAANCSGIVLTINSPGGSVRGTSELADEIYQARQKTNVVAFSDGLVASAAYWLGSAASKIYGTASAEFGCIGAILQTVSLSRMFDSMGVDVSTFTSKGAGVKAAGNPFKAMTDGERATLQRGVDKAGEMFASTVARNRPGMSGTGDGAMFFASDAKAGGLIDGIVPDLNAVVSNMQSSSDYDPLMAPDGKHHPNRASALARADAAYLRAVARGQAPMIPATTATKPRVTSTAPAGTLEEIWAAMPAAEKREFFGSFKTFCAYRRHAHQGRASHGGGSTSSANFKK